MKTYYQKHHTIKAFQFDGTWQCIHEALPQNNHFLNTISTLTQNQINYPTATIHYNQNHMITDMTADIVEWPRHNHKFRHPYGYTSTYTKLHRYDYVVLKCEPRGLKMDDSYTKNIHHIRWTDIIQLRFYRPWDFEAHWSTQPIKKR